MAKVWVNGQELEIQPDDRLNGIQAAARLGHEVPHYCWHAGMSVVASCRMCLVETGTRNPETGAIAMFPKLVPACQTPAKDGTVFITDSPKVKASRAMVEEYLLMDHPIDCPICDKAGECSLQDYHFKYGQKERRLDVEPFHSRRRDVGPTVTLFVDRCVMCTRCVRFTREVAGTSELMVANRGSHEEIDVFPGFELKNKLSGNVVDLCPVGALGDKDFLYTQRVWWLKKHDGVCGGCSTGCSITTEENQDVVYRLKPRENQAVNQWWMCDEGRYGYHYSNSEDRFAGPWKREGAGWNMLDWTQIFPQLKSQFATAQPLAAVVSPHLTVEEAYLLCKWARSVDPSAQLVLGPVPVVGQDEHFKAGFTIRAEKAPNAKGVIEVLNHFGNWLSFADLLPQVDSGKFKSVWVSGGYHDGNWIDEATAVRFAQVPLLVVQDLFRSPLSEKAHYILPGTSFAEKDGSWVNHAERLQSFRWAVRPRPGVRGEGSLFQQMLGGKSMFRSGEILAEIAQAIPYFSACREEIPATGVELKVPELAAAGV